MFPILGMSAYERYSDETLSSRSVGGGWISDQFWHARPIVGVLHEQKVSFGPQAVERGGEIGESPGRTR